MEPHKCESIKWYDDWDKLPEPLFTDYKKYMPEGVVKGFLKKAKR
jgi:hypothetical protein